MSMLADSPAFPCFQDEYETSPGGQKTHVLASSGMTYRQWLAGIVMAGLAADPSFEGPRDGTPFPASAARYAVDWADALIAELEKTPSEPRK